LLDTAAELIGLRRTDDRGVSWLTVPSPGHFAVFVQKQGYSQLVSNWLALGATDTLEVTFRLSAVAQRLSRVVVTAEIDSVGPLFAWDQCEDHRGSGDHALEIVVFRSSRYLDVLGSIERAVYDHHLGMINVALSTA
jgi:hypothetical protein